MPMSRRQPFHDRRRRAASVASASRSAKHYGHAPDQFGTPRATSDRQSNRGRRRQLHRKPSIASRPPRDSARHTDARSAESRPRFSTKNVATYAVSAQDRHLDSADPAPPQQTAFGQKPAPQPQKALRRSARGPPPRLRSATSKSRYERLAGKAQQIPAMTTTSYHAKRAFRTSNAPHRRRGTAEATTHSVHHRAGGRAASSDNPDNQVPRLRVPPPTA